MGPVGQPSLPARLGERQPAFVPAMSDSATMIRAFAENCRLAAANRELVNK